MGIRFSISTDLYIAFSEDDSVLYVGISSQSKYRIKEHKAKSCWYIHAVRFEIISFDNRFEAMTAEKEAIKKYMPEYNLQSNPRYVRNGYQYFEAC